MTEPKQRARLPITVSKPTPYTFDLGLLLANDPNPLILNSSSTIEEDLTGTARDGAQVLLNQLLSTCPITSTPNGVLLSLPAPITALPREKPLPPPTAQTTWQRFALKKGIKAKTAAQRQKMVYDEATGEWVPKWGYKGANKKAEEQWIVEVDPKKEREEREAARKGGKAAEGGLDGRAGSRAERKERIRRNERKMRANERRGVKGALS